MDDNHDGVAEMVGTIAATAASGRRLQAAVGLGDKEVDGLVHLGPNGIEVKGVASTREKESQPEGLCWAARAACLQRRGPIVKGWSGQLSCDVVAADQSAGAGGPARSVRVKVRPCGARAKNDVSVGGRCWERGRQCLGD